MAPQPKTALYDDSSDEEAPKFGVNKDFAAAYQSKKQTEELSKLQDKYGKDYTLSDEESEEEELSDDDSDAEFVTPQVDAAILRTLAKIRNKDPAVYEGGRQVFDEEESGITAGPSSSKKPAKGATSKPVLLKDYQRSRMLADPTLSISDETPDASFQPTFAQEERALKDEVTKAFGAGAGDSDEDDDGLLVRRSKTKDERQQEEEDYAKFLKENAGDRAVEDALEAEEKFLRDYILNRGWIDRNAARQPIPSYNEITGGDEADPEESDKAAKKIKKKKQRDINAEIDAAARAAIAAGSGDEDDGHEQLDPGAHDSEDSEFEDVADEFETKYNFRFEEAGSNLMTTHSRNAVSTVRKPTTAVTARARAREAAKEKKEEEKRERKEEVRRLKALKRKEVEAKLLQLVEAAGEGTSGLENIDLEGEWDPEAHDRKMAEVYGEEYGDGDDADFKPTWDDDIDITDLVGADGEAYSDDDADMSMPFVDIETGDVGDEDMDLESSVVMSKKEQKKEKKEKKRKRDEEGFPTELLKAAKRGGDEERKQLLDKMVDDYYGIEYEDKIGDLPTRFKYTKVAPSAFDLTPTEILLATDAELNAYMSLRKMAPYRNDADAASKAAKNKKKLQELRHALKNRKWGEEVDVEQAAEEQEERKRKKAKWVEEGKRQKEGGAGPSEPRGEKKKRIGKSERKRRKAAAEGTGEGSKDE